MFRQERRMQAAVTGTVAAGRGRRGEGVCAPGRHCAEGGIWSCENMELCNLANSGELAFALQNGFGGNLHCVLTSPNSAYCS